jgi:hypothetical protein
MIPSMTASNTSNEPAPELLKALCFAARKHSRQRRKDSEATPYINHPIAVAELLARVGELTNVAQLQAAILHDVLEDTPTPPTELDGLFGEDVRKLVQEDHLGGSKKQFRVSLVLLGVTPVTYVGRGRVGFQTGFQTCATSPYFRPFALSAWLGGPRVHPEEP